MIMKVIVLLVLWGWCMCVSAQEEKIKWLSIGEAEKLYQENPKPLILDFYTDWCGWCKHMDKTTYTNPAVVSFVTKYFYPVKINAESSDTVYFRGKMYAPVKNGNRYLNSLAIEMLKGKLSYPTTVFLHDKEKINLIVPGYLDVTKMEAFMVYFVENAYTTTNVNDFITAFERVFKPEQNAVPEKEADYWTGFADLEKKQSGKKKKTMLFLSASWSNSSRMMEKDVFADSAFSALAQKYFYCLHLDAQSKDTLTFMGHQFANAGDANSNLHQLAIALSDKVIRVPSIYIFDEDGKLMERLYFYLDKHRGAMVLDYIGSDTYKNMSWMDYMEVKSKESL